jgi:hypothetical protein
MIKKYQNNSKKEIIENLSNGKDLIIPDGLQNFDNIINSKEYKCKLSELLTSLLIRTKSVNTESSIAFVFQSEIYSFVKGQFGINLKFEQEENQTTLRHKFVGRMDAVCNDLVIEYKRPDKLNNDKDKDKATTQLSNYLIQLLQEEKIEYQGVLTDGIKLKYIYFQEGIIHSTSFKNINEADLDKIVQSLTDVNNKRFVPKNIVDDFKLFSKTNVTSDLAK